MPDYINRISTNQVKNIFPYSCRKTIFINEKGRIIDLTLYLNFGEYQLLAGRKGNRDKLQRWIERYLVSDDVKIYDVTDGYGAIKLSGRCVDRYVYAKFDVDTSVSWTNNIILFEFERRHYSLTRFESTAGYPEVMILGNSEEIGNLYNKLQLPGDEGKPEKISPEEYRSLLVEFGIPGRNEIKDLFNPHELKLLAAVDFKKSCYIGREIIARLDTHNKVQRYLCRLELCEDYAGGEDYILYNNAEEIGRVTSVTRSILNNKPIALGVLRKEYIVEGNKLLAIGNNPVEEVYFTVKRDWSPEK